MTTLEQRIKLPLPLLVSCAILLDSLSIWNNRPLNFSTDHLPLASTSRLNVPDVAVSAAPVLAWRFTFLTTSLLISARISLERMFASSDSASRPWIALRSCASSNVYSALSALDFAVTVYFSIVKDISAKFS